jgi:hypothetical protein
MRTIYALTILTTLAIGTVALAEPNGGGHGARKLERLDANRDGKVTLAEMKSDASQKFKRLDADKNGRVGKEELAAHHEQMRAKWAQRLAEKRAARGADPNANKKHGHHHRHQAKAGGFVAKLDRKVLTGAELARRRGGKHGHGHDCGRQHPRAGASTGAAGGAANAR